MMRLFYHPMSSYAQRVRIVLHEKQLGDRVELAVIDMPSREHRGEPFLGRNPYGRVPVLEHDDLVLFESTAILEYLEALFPTPPLLPGDARGRALAAMHMKLCDVELGAHSRTLIFPARFVPRDRWRLEPMASAREAVTKHLQILDGMLGDRSFLLGDAYTLADVCYTPLVRFLDEIEVEAPPRIRAWAERLLARPSVRANWLER